MSKNTMRVCLVVLLLSSLCLIKTLKAQSALSLNSRSEGNLRNPLSQNAANSLSSAYMNMGNDGLAYSLGWFRPFEIKEIEERFVAIHYSRRQLAVNASFWQSGDDLFNESILQLGFQAKINSFSLGIKPQFQQMSVQGFSNRQAWRMQAFVGLNFSENWLYYSLINWQTASNELADQRLPNQSINVVAGIHYSFKKRLSFGVELSQNSFNGLDCRIAQKLVLVDNTLHLSTGYDVLRSMPTVGLVVQVKRLSIQIHYSYHPYLSKSTGGAVHFHSPISPNKR